MATDYDRIVYEFFENEKSAVVLVSEDNLFIKTLRSTLTKVLAVRRECLFTFHSTQKAARLLKDRSARRMPTFLFSESVLGGKMVTSFLSTVNETYPNLNIIALVSETRSADIAYLYEIGANNVIAKPASANNIIEKMAFTLKPQGKLTEYVGAAKSYLGRNETEKAVRILRKVLEIKPGSPTGYMLMGDAFQQMGKDDKALEAYLEAHRNAPVFIEPLKRLASFFQEKDMTAHLDYLLKLDKLSPLNAERKRDIGSVHFRQGRMDKAETYFDQALDCADREASNLIENIATSIADLVAEAAPELSEKYLEKILATKSKRLSRADLTTFNRLGIVLKKQGKWQKAIEHYQKALEIAPDDEGLYYNMGMAYVDGGNNQMAAKCLDKALRINPGFYVGNPTVCENLGNVYYSLNDLDMAEKFFNSALETDPGHNESKRMLRRIAQARAKKKS